MCKYAEDTEAAEDAEQLEKIIGMCAMPLIFNGIFIRHYSHIFILIANPLGH